jgi:hypothetical protein
MKNLKLLSYGFMGIENTSLTFEQVRDHWRTTLHNKNPTEYPAGPVGISVTHLASELLKIDTLISCSQYTCPACGYAENPVDDRLGYVLYADDTVTDSTTQWIDKLSQKTHRTCPQCRASMTQILCYKQVPPILVLEYPFKNIVTSHTLEFKTNTGTKKLKLQGIVYHGQYHFTSCIVSIKNQVWCHDGMVIGRSCINEGYMNNMSDENLKKCKQRNLVPAIYAQSF